MQKNHSLNQTGSIWLKNVHFLNQPKNQFCNFFAEAYKTHRIQFKSTGDFFGNSFRKKKPRKRRSVKVQQSLPVNNIRRPPVEKVKQFLA
jgi:hypothetical protein